MNTFSSLFGIRPSDLKNSCILTPFLNKRILKQLKIGTPSRGRLYETGSNDFLTLIKTGLGPALAGDAALYLKDTPCRNIILFGSCGLIRKTHGLDLGSLVSPLKCYELESFSGMLSNKNSHADICFPDDKMSRSLISASTGHDVIEVTNATVGSLKMEMDYIKFFDKISAQTVDMECSAVFSAAKSAGLKASALLYISDIITEKPFFAGPTDAETAILDSSVTKALDILCRFTKALTLS